MERSLERRLATAAVLLAAAVAGFLWAPAAVLEGACLLVLVLAAREWGRLGQLAAFPWLVLALGALVWRYAHALALPLLVVGALWWLLAVVPVAAGGRPWPAGRGAHAVIGLLALLPAWAALLALVGHPAGRGVALGALALVWAADTAAYFVGRRFGRHKLAPAISPGKTVEGLAGGLGAAGVVGAALAALLGMSAWTGAALALVAAAASVVGDLVESLLKRRAGVKDSGALLPGHGGVLDRVDALLAALPIFALGLAWAA